MVGFPPPGQTFPAVSDGKAMYAFPFPALMQTASSAATADRGSGMGRLAGFHAAAVGKHHVNNSSCVRKVAGTVQRLIVAAATLMAALAFSATGYAQSGPFAGLAGVWSGAGTV